MDGLDETAARAIVVGVVARKLPMFAAYRDYDRDDLISIGLTAVRQAWPKFNRAKSAPSTFIYRVAACQLIDLSRTLSGRLRRDHIAASNTPTVTRDTEEAYDPDSLADWLGNIYRMARRNFVTYNVPLRLPRANTGTIDRAQRAALVALQTKMKLSCRGLAMVMAQRPELCRAIGLADPPSYLAIFRAKESVSRIDFSRRIAV